jgi:NADPH:quinone reductase
VRALSLTEYSGPSALRIVETDVPTPGDGELLVRVEAIGINFPDLLMTKGEYQLRPALPVTPGCELAGLVLRAPAGSRFREGDPVAAFVWSGGYAEVAVVPEDSAVRIPGHMPADVAAAIMVNYHTAYFSLAERARLAEGEQVLVLGAAGGIGTAAIQIARGLGATVTAGVADEAQADLARQAGAHRTVILEGRYSKAVRELCGDGVDVVADPLGDWLTLEGLRSLRPYGRLVTIGFAAGGIPEIKLNRLLLNNIAIVGAAWGASLELDTGLLARGSAAIIDLWDRGHVRPLIGGRFPFAEIPQALESLAAGRIRGKAVALVPEVGRP